MDMSKHNGKAIGITELYCLQLEADRAGRDVISRACDRAMRGDTYTAVQLAELDRLLSRR